MAGWNEQGRYILFFRRWFSYTVYGVLFFVAKRRTTTSKGKKESINQLELKIYGTSMCFVYDYHSKSLVSTDLPETFRLMNSLLKRNYFCFLFFPRPPSLLFLFLVGASCVI